MDDWNNWNNWKRLDIEPHKALDDIDVGPDRGDGSRYATGMASIFSALGGDSERDDTASIRSFFMHKHRDEYDGDADKDDKKRYTKYGFAKHKKYKHDYLYDYYDDEYKGF